MSRPALTFLASVIVPAIAGLSPAAHAGYIPVAGLPTAVDGLDTGMTGRSEPALLLPAQLELKKLPYQLALNDAPCGSMTPPPSGAGGHGPTTGYVPPADVSPTNLVVYYRESADRFDLPSFATFILDPPRSR